MNDLIEPRKDLYLLLSKMSPSNQYDLSIWVAKKEAGIPDYDNLFMIIRIKRKWIAKLIRWLLGKFTNINFDRLSFLNKTYL